MEGTVQYEGSGDVFLTFYNGNTVLENMPVKDNVDNLAFERAECDKGASISWNRNRWAPMITNLKESKTKCKLYFGPKVASDTIYDIADKDTVNLAYDDTNDENLRYIGSSPKNYIDIGDRDSSNNPILWRIIGVMNNMTVINDDESENNGQSLVKIIRADSIGAYSWDSSTGGTNGVNMGYGVNEWSQADLMKLLNPENIYIKDSEIGNSLYWNKAVGQCYNSSNNGQTTCDFRSTGLTETVKDKIAKVRWNTGTMPDEYSKNYNKTSAIYMYQGERSDNHGKKFCSSGYECNDTVERSTTWDGYIGLIYPSDYGYAIGGNYRDKCLNNSMYNWNESSLSCKSNWLLSTDQLTLTSIPNKNLAYYVFRIEYNSHLDYTRADGASAVRPIVYLKSNIKIKANSESNYGSQANPFELES